MHSKTPYIFVFNLSSAFGWPEGRAGYRYNDLALGSERHGPCCTALSGLVARRSLVSPWRVSCEQILANPGSPITAQGGYLFDYGIEFDDDATYLTTFL
jgi:hypothetical protein